MPASSSRSDQNITFHLPRSSLKIAGIAFAVGLLLFVVVWLNARRNNDFYRADPAQPQTAVAELAPLPAPLPAGAGAADMPEARPAPVEEKPELVEAPPAPPPQPIAETAPTQSPAGDAPAPVAATPTDRPSPLPGQRPPEYPPAALRRGDSGTVVVQVVVGVDGTALDARVIQRSGSRDLDRAALDAVRGWRFQPALSNGQPMQASLDIPFDFKPAQ